jgi:hypothetical protein
MKPIETPYRNPVTASVHPSEKISPGCKNHLARLARIRTARPILIWIPGSFSRLFNAILFSLLDLFFKNRPNHARQLDDYDLDNYDRKADGEQLPTPDVVEVAVPGE